MIAVENVHVTFNAGTPNETRALRGLDLSIEAGQFVTVIGSNGAGKSTMLGVLSGETAPDTGRVMIDEQDVSRWPTPRRAPLVARVFQDPMAGTCGNLSVEENMALAYARGRGRGLGFAVNNDLRELFAERLKQLNLGLEDRLKSRMGLLSGGQRQAITLVMAALRPMKILLLDEHTAALDPKTASFVMDLTDRIVAENKLTALMVTHSMRQALDHGHRTLMLHQGQVVLDVAGSEREGKTVEDLLHMFEKVRGQEVDDDALILT